MTEREDVDAVARAICKSRSCEGGSCCEWPANMGRIAAECPVKRSGYDDAAQAALTAAKPYIERALLRDFINSDHALHCQGDEAARRYARDLGYGDVGDQR